jgi:hypothetical protein
MAALVIHSFSGPRRGFATLLAAGIAVMSILLWQNVDAAVAAQADPGSDLAGGCETGLDDASVEDAPAASMAIVSPVVYMGGGEAGGSTGGGVTGIGGSGVSAGGEGDGAAGSGGGADR